MQRCALLFRLALLLALRLSAQLLPHLVWTSGPLKRLRWSWEHDPPAQILPTYSPECLPACLPLAGLAWLAAARRLPAWALLYYCSLRCMMAWTARAARACTVIVLGPNQLIGAIGAPG